MPLAPAEEGALSLIVLSPLAIHACHRPRKRTIQQMPAQQLRWQRMETLDAPLSRGMTAKNATRLDALTSPPA
jgi:hypothetical protein